MSTGSCIRGSVYYVMFISKILHSSLLLSVVSAWLHTIHTIPTGARHFPLVVATHRYVVARNYKAEVLNYTYKFPLIFVTCKTYCH